MKNTKFLSALAIMTFAMSLGCKTKSNNAKGEPCDPCLHEIFAPIEMTNGALIAIEDATFKIEDTAKRQNLTDIYVREYYEYAEDHGIDSAEVYIKRFIKNYRPLSIPKSKTINER